MKNKQKKKKNMGAEIIAALRDTNRLITRGKKLTVREVSVSVVPEECDAHEIQSIRQKFGCSQAAFAAFLGVPLATLSSWERGKRSPSSMAQRFLYEMRENPDYWRARLMESWRIAG
jgi:DNA-binding transcriptional regulator YiaG